jgi:hypothetical protein
MTYVVAEEDATKAVAMIRTLVGSAPGVESIGRASPKLLLALRFVSRRAQERGLLKSRPGFNRLRFATVLTLRGWPTSAKVLHP